MEDYTFLYPIPKSLHRLCSQKQKQIITIKKRKKKKIAYHDYWHSVLRYK